MMERQRAVADVVADRIPTSTSVASFIGADGTNADDQQRAPLDHPQAARATRAPSADEIIARLQPKLADGRRDRALPAGRAGPPDRQPRQPHAVPVHARGRRRRRARATWAPQLARRSSRRSPELARRRQRSADRRAQVSAHDRSRHRLAPRRHAAGHRRHALRRLRPAPGLDHLHPAQPVPRHPRGEARVPAEPGRARSRSTCDRPPGEQVPLARVRAAARRRRRRSSSTIRANSRRSRSRSTSRRASSLGDAVDAIHARRGRRSGCRPAFTPSFQGTAQAFQRLARERAAPHPRGAHHRLHRARRPLRELHPPDHDPLDAARRPASARSSR